MTKVLFLGALPDGTTRLRLDRELRGIEQALAQADCRDRLAFTAVWASTFDDLLSELQRLQPDIVHFSGHGTPDALLFERRDGKAGPVSAEALTRLFAALPSRLVVFNACDSLGLATAVAAHVECAVGTTEPIGDLGAVLFAAAFYRALALGSSVAQAAELGRVAILGANLQGADDVQVVGASDRPFMPLAAPPAGPPTDPTGWVDALFNLAIDHGLDGKRSLLLRGLPPRYVSSLRTYAIPADQLRADLHELCRTSALRGHPGHPLVAWLHEAATALDPRPEADVFPDFARRLGGNV